MPDPSVELETPRLTLRPLPPAAAALLPRGRAAAAELIGAELDRDWPQPDLLEILPRQAAPGADAAYGAWARTQPGVTSVVAGTVPGNEASERVLERLGFLRSEVRDGENRWTSHAR